MLLKSFLLMVALYGCASAQIAFDTAYRYDAVDSLIMRGIAHVYEENFDGAFAVFDSVISADSSSLRGYFFMTAAYNNLKGDYKNRSYIPLFIKYLDKTIRLGKLKEKSGRANAEDLFYYGSAIGYRAIFKSHAGDWFGALKDGLKGRSLMKSAVRADSSNRDILLGLGFYDYWRSAATKAFNWLPFFPDSREKGISQILVAADSGKFASLEAINSLMRIYVDYKEYDRTVELWENSLKDINPLDPYGLYWLGQAYYCLGQYEKSLDCYQKILSIYLKSPYYDLAGEMESRFYIGQSLFHLGRYDEAVRELSISSKQARSLKGREDVEEALKNVDKLLRDAQDNMVNASQ
jgi:tetratricopeptide (TPR) repeat protein